MLVKGFILFVLISITALFAVASLVVFIVKRKDKVSRKIWMNLFVASLVVSISFSGYGLYSLYEVFEKSDNSLQDKVLESPQVKLLKSYETDRTIVIPNSFYSCFGFRDWYRYPIKYPYSINCADNADFGMLEDETGVTDVCDDSNSSKELNISNIRTFSFDQKLLLLKIEERNNKGKEPSYTIFNFETQATISVDTDIELFRKAKESGYTGIDSLITIKEYEQLF